MPTSLKERVEKLERQVSELAQTIEGGGRQKDWRRTIGVFADDPYFDEVVRLGQEYREQQHPRRRRRKSDVDTGQ